MSTFQGSPNDPRLPPTPGPDVLLLEADEWAAVLDSAATLDLVRGGYYRARGGRILLYCDPENAPAGWQWGFADGSPELPRALVGVAEAAEPGPVVQVTLRVENWAALRAGGTESLAGGPAEREWLRRRFALLRAHAAGTLVGEP